MQDESGVRDTPMMFKLNNPRVKKQPKGVGLIISPWNYPWFLVLGPMTGAIAAGCPFVIKVSRKHVMAIIDLPLFTIVFLHLSLPSTPKPVPCCSPNSYPSTSTRKLTASASAPSVTLPASSRNDGDTSSLLVLPPLVESSRPPQQRTWFRVHSNWEVSRLPLSLKMRILTRRHAES